MRIAYHKCYNWKTWIYGDQTTDKEGLGEIRRAL